jgi:hypothetical protein
MLIGCRRGIEIQNSFIVGVVRGKEEIKLGDLERRMVDGWRTK